MTFIASRMERIGASPTLATRMLATRLRAEGRDVLAVSAGEPDFETPEHIKDAATAAMRAGATRYTEISGTRALRQAIADKFRTDNAIDYALDEITVGAGAKQVIFNALLATVEPGDEVIIPTPCWVSYPDIVTFAGGTALPAPCGANAGFRLTPAALEAAITDRTKWLILNNPGNPTGTAYDAAALRELAAVLLRHPHVWVLTDEIYEKLIYDDVVPATVAQAEPRLRARTLTVNGCSKSYAMTGWRIGYAGGPRMLIAAMDKLQGQSTSNASSISQAAAVAALNGPQDSVVAMRAAFAHRRDLVIARLQAVPGLRCHVPDGAFYAFPDLAACLGRTSAGGALIVTDTDFTTALLAEQGVAVVPGSAFLAPTHFRMSFAADEPTLLAACARIHQFCAELH